MRKTLLFLVPAVLIIVGAVYLFANKKTTPIQPVTETENTQTETVNEVPTPGTTTTETVVINETVTSKLNMDLSKYKTPIMIIDAKKTYTAKMKTTAGDIELSLNAAATPITVNNFVFLSQKNFYDNVIFHRAIKGFMIQGGDPTGTGSGGPGYQFDDEPFTGEYTRGTLAMANAGANTNGSQFFIMHADNPLPPNYVIFGKVTKGLDVVDKIATAPVTESASGEMSKPVNPVKILSVEIMEK